ncbi:hypothetical protein ACB272_17470 [Klebsiella pneumoniae]
MDCRLRRCRHLPQYFPVPGIARTPVTYSNPAYDEALRNAAKASDVATRGKYYQQAEDLLAQDVPAIPVYHYVRTHLVKPWVGGFTPDKLGYYYTKDMYIKKHPSASGDGR